LEQLKSLTSPITCHEPTIASCEINSSWSSRVFSVTGLERLKNLTSLTLDVSNSGLATLAGLEQLNGLTSLTLNLSNSRVTSLAGLEQLKSLTSLALYLSGSQVASLAELEQLKHLTSLEVWLPLSLVEPFAQLRISAPHKVDRPSVRSGALRQHDFGVTGRNSSPRSGSFSCPFGKAV
jgi:hypothetical protein